MPDLPAISRPRAGETLFDRLLAVFRNPPGRRIGLYVPFGILQDVCRKAAANTLEKSWVIEYGSRDLRRLAGRRLDLYPDFKGKLALAENFQFLFCYLANGQYAGCRVL